MKRVRTFMVMWTVTTAACGGEPPSSSGSVEQTQTGTAGWVQFMARADQAVKQGTNTFSVDLTPRQGTLPEDAQLTVTVTMPAHHHSAPTPPNVDVMGDGHYHVRDVVFSMSGAWEVRYHVVAGTQSDDATFHYEVP